MSQIKCVIGVIGGGECTPAESNAAYETGKRIAEGGAVLLTGGRGGVMEAASRGAREAGGEVIAVLPGSGPELSAPNPYVEIPVYTGMGNGRNIINVLTARVLIAIGGGWGTLSEIALACKVGRPVVLLHSWKLDPSRLRGAAPMEAANPEEAVRYAFDAIGDTF